MKLSFILPVYNVAPWLRACLDSIQKIDGVELICVDDGSTDETGSILDEYSDRVNVVHQRNAGVGAARNKGLGLATGDYISFVDPDDLLREGAVEEMLSQIQEHPDVDIISYANVQFNDGNAPVWTDTGFERLVEVSAAITEESMRMCVCGAAFKKSVLPQHGFLPYCVGEDLVFVGECLCRAHKVILSGKAIYGYRQRKGSATHSNVSYRKIIDDIQYCRKLIEVFLRSHKQVDPKIYRRLGLKMTEGYIGSLYSLMCPEKEELWRRWYDSLMWMKELKVFPLWTSFVVKACLLLRLKSLAYVLCLLPLRLKLKGFHR